MKYQHDPYVPAEEWKRRAMRAEKHARQALEILAQMANRWPDPYGQVCLCAYLGITGTDPTKAGPSIPTLIDVIDLARINWARDQGMARL